MVGADTAIDIMREALLRKCAGLDDAGDRFKVMEEYLLWKCDGRDHSGYGFLPSCFLFQMHTMSQWIENEIYGRQPKLRPMLRTFKIFSLCCFTRRIFIQFLRGVQPYKD